MIKFIYATKNKLSANFNNPMFYDFDKDAARESFTISALETPAEGKKAIKELEVYFLGTFDTKLGVFVPDNDFIVDLGQVLELKENGREEN